MRDAGLLGHSLVYGAAQLASAAASVALLPLYSSCLSPRDYGVVAILEASAAVIAALALGGLAPAATRLHHRRERQGREHEVWTTGLVGLTALIAVLLAIGMAARPALAALLLGADVAAGETYATLFLITVAANLLVNFGLAYLRAEKRSSTFLWVTLAALGLRVGLNVWLLAGLDWGVRGYLWSAAAAGAAQAAALLVLLFAGRRFSLDRAAGRELFRFGAPLAVAALASLAMHHADVFLLRWLLPDLADLGIYAFAYGVVQRVNGLVLTPFVAIWGASLYEIDRDDAPPDRLARYRRVFRAYTLVAGFILFALAICAEPLLALLAGPAFRPAAALVPTLAGAFLLFSLHSFFVVPALVHGRSGAVSRSALVAAAANVALVLLLVPRSGVEGAALASLLTYAVYAFFGEFRYRRIEDLGYPLAHVLRIVAVGSAAYWAYRLLAPADSTPWISLAAALGATLLFAAALWLLAGRGLRLRPQRSARTPTPAVVSSR